MSKINGWLVTIIGLVMVLGLIPGMGFNWSTMWVQWALAILVLVVGIVKLTMKGKK